MWQVTSVVFRSSIKSRFGVTSFSTSDAILNVFLWHHDSIRYHLHPVTLPFICSWWEYSGPSQQHSNTRHSIVSYNHHAVHCIPKVVHLWTGSLCFFFQLSLLTLSLHLYAIYLFNQRQGTKTEQVRRLILFYSGNCDRKNSPHLKVRVQGHFALDFYRDE